MIDLCEASKFFPIEGVQVRLKVFTENNITDNYLSWLNDSAVVKFSMQRFVPRTRQTSLDYLRSFVNTANTFLAVYLKHDERYVGTMSVVFSAEHEAADIAIMIGDKACWGRGVGGDAWITLSNWLLQVAGIKKVTGGAIRCNASMIKIMINAGMQLDNVWIAYDIVDGQPQDAMFFSKAK